MKRTHDQIAALLRRLEGQIDQARRDARTFAAEDRQPFAADLGQAAEFLALARDRIAAAAGDHERAALAPEVA